MKFGIGQSVMRTEDLRFVTGRGCYVDDLRLPDTLHAAIVRSPFAHARIGSIDTRAAAGMDGVRAILTGAEYQEEGIGGIACHTIFPGMRNVATRKVPALAIERVRYAGMPVAIVIAQRRSQARDAADKIAVDYEELPAVVAAHRAVEKNAPRIWEDAPENIAFEISLGDAEAVQSALVGAAHVARIRIYNNRVSANALETRGTAAHFSPRDGRLTVYASTQSPHSLRADIASALQISHTQLRVIAMDVGGGFGMKGGVYPEDILVAWAARKLQSGVAWQADRSESLLSDYHGRDQTVDGSLALDENGTITALEIGSDYNIGAFLSPGGGVAPMFSAALATGCYKVPVAHVHTRAIYTNTSPTQPYRGAGRPEAAFLIERLLDKAARETGHERIALRRKNMLRAGDMPYKTPLVYTIDSGDYEAVLDRALALADWEGAKNRRQAARNEGKLRGIGVALHMENAGLANEFAEIRFDPGGDVTVLAGTFSHGQGHETVYAQMISDWLGVDFDRIRIVQGDTDAVQFGRGTIASRSMINGGASLRLAADRVIEKARNIVAHRMEARPDDIEFEAGRFVVAGTDRAMRIEEAAALSFMPVLPPELGLGLSGQGEFKLEGFTFPNGCQVAEVEVDPQTGQTEIVKIVSVDDVGRVINPMLLEGQLVGGIVQGIGQAVMEDFIYDRNGQVATGSFMDYAMPRAEDVPPIAIETRNSDTNTNPLGIKGAGESGTVGATPAVISAILDALHDQGVNDLPLPATPAAIWAALTGSRPLSRSGAEA